MGQKRRHFGNDSGLSVLNSEKMKHASDNVMILDYNQYVSQYLSMYVFLRCSSHSLRFSSNSIIVLFGRILLLARFQFAVIPLSVYISVTVLTSVT